MADRLPAAAAATAASLVLAECTFRHFAPAREVGAAFTQYDDYYGKRLKTSASLVRETPEFTMQLTTNRKEFPARIAARLGDDPAVVNAGVGDVGYGCWLLFLRRDAPRLAPRAVVLQVQDNDFGDNQRERLFALADGALTALPVPPPGLGRRVQVWIDRVPGLADCHLIGRLRLLVDRPAGAAAGGGAAVRGERERAVTQAFAARGVPVVRIPTKLERPDLYFEVDGHWNAAGHAFAAEAILAELRGLGALARRPRGPSETRPSAGAE